MAAKTKIRKLLAVLWLASHAALGGVLDDVRERGTMRVATTGDYRPFSYRIDGELTGIDVDLARALAAALEVDLEWVPTSWRSLESDLDARRFDIAMSGISVTAERGRVGLFSLPYFDTGKTLLARCAVADRFASLTDVDRADVTVIVNPGGTNQRYVEQHVHHAHIVVHDDNIGVFDALAQGKADVMITDAIEAQLVSLTHNDLCLSNPTLLLAPVTKAWFMPRDETWRVAVDQILASLIATGTVAKAIHEHVPSR